MDLGLASTMHSIASRDIRPSFQIRYRRFGPEMFSIMQREEWSCNLTDGAYVSASCGRKSSPVPSISGYVMPARNKQLDASSPKDEH